jgi:hypothetical protein
MTTAVGCTLLSLVLTSQAVEIPALQRLNDIILCRTRMTPSSAVYEMKGPPGNTFAGRHTKCRCYTDSDGSYFVEESCDSWTSRVWVLSNRIVWRYSDSTGQYAFVGPIVLAQSPEVFLEKKGFAISLMSAFDRQCLGMVRLAKSGQMNGETLDAIVNGSALRVGYTSGGFDIEYTTEPPLTISYRSTESLPAWKRDADSLLSEVDVGKVAARRLGEKFSFVSAMEIVAEEDSRDVAISTDELPDVARVHGYLLSKDPRFRVQDAMSSGHGRWLQLKVTFGVKRFECVQYKVIVDWDNKGRLLNEPIAKNTIIRSQILGAGQLLLVSNGNGAIPTTCFVHRSGQVLASVGNVFDDKDFLEMVATLRCWGRE